MTRRAIPGLLALLYATLWLGACQPDLTRAPGNDDDKAACEAKGGDYRQAGILGNMVCVLAAPDAGKACIASDECSGMCMAESRTCSRVTPMFGCHSIIEDGETVEICID